MQDTRCPLLGLQPAEAAFPGVAGCDRHGIPERMAGRTGWLMSEIAIDVV